MYNKVFWHIYFDFIIANLCPSNVITNLNQYSQDNSMDWISYNHDKSQCHTFWNYYVPFQSISIKLNYISTRKILLAIIDLVMSTGVWCLKIFRVGIFDSDLIWKCMKITYLFFLRFSAIQVVVSELNSHCSHETSYFWMVFLSAILIFLDAGFLQYFFPRRGR